MKMLQFAAVLLLLSNFTSQLSIAHAQGTAFTYQGTLNDGSSPANGTYDVQFTLYATNVMGSAIAGLVTNSATAVSNGLFTATIDFGPGVFTGTNYWLDIAVRTNGAATFTELMPRQPILPAPYAIFANTASNVSGTVSASQLSGPIPLAQLPASVLTNGASSINISGMFNGNGSGLTNLNAAKLTGSIPTNSLTSVPAGSLTGIISQDNLGISGAYTPYIGDGTNIFYNNGNQGYYIKIGSLVYVEAFVEWGSKLSADSSANVQISLPTSIPNASQYANFTIGAASGINYSGSLRAYSQGYNSNPYVLLWSDPGAGGTGTLLVSACGNSGFISFSGFYRWQ